MQKDDVLLRMEGICKSFPGVKALDDAQLTVRPGTVHALMGENGAGKSTLMKCLFGIYSKDAGTIWFDGKEVNFKSSRDALDNGVAMVHQELNQALKRSVMDNIWLGRYPRIKLGGAKMPFVSDKAEYDMTMEVFKDLNFEKFGININPRTIMSTMPVSRRQMVEIAKAVSFNSKIIVLDEPTAMLDPNGRKDVIRAARALNDVENVTIILITHYMEEVIYADRVFVMDEGKVVMQGTPREIFSQVERLKHLRLDVPQVTLLAYELQKSGLKLPDGILTAQELTEELKKLCTGSKTGASDNRQMPVK